ncbi:MAG: Ig-like domain-containing protein, partial [Armatimonadota bacterium]
MVCPAETSSEISSSTSVGPVVQGSSVWTDGNRELIFTPSQRLKAYRNYRVTVSTKAQSAQGGPLAEDLQWTFQTKDCLAVVAYSPAADVRVPCNAPVVIDFDRDVALSTAKKYFSIEPEVPGVLTLLTPRKLQFQPLAPLANSSTYSITLAASMAGLDKVQLLKPFSWSFTTEGPARVIGMTPVGNAATLSSKVTVTFDRAMDRASAQAAFSLRFAPALGLAASEPVPAPDLDVAGSFSWNSAGTVLTFTPARWLQANTGYLITLAKTAVSAAGAPLASDYSSAFATANSLQILSATPTTSGAAINSVLRITFDRAVDPGKLILKVVPAGATSTAIEGTLTWLDTSNALFTPRYPLAAQTRYTATIAHTLTAVDGTTLSKDYVWHFGTHGLTRAVAYSPRGAGVKPGTAIVIRFDRPMDPVSVAANLQVFQIGATETPITGQITWDEDGTRVTFTPLARLAAFTDYHVVVGASALSADNLMLASKLEWIFQTTRAVQIVAFAPTGNQVAPGAAIDLQFDRQMGRASVQEAFSILPEVPGTFQWSDGYHLRFQPTAALSPGRTYRVTLGANAHALNGLR